MACSGTALAYCAYTQDGLKLIQQIKDVIKRTTMQGKGGLILLQRQTNEICHTATGNSFS
jgi:hypothetical protein